MSVDIQELRKLQLQEDQVRAKKESFRKDAIDTINCLIAMFGFKPSDLDFEGTCTPKILKGTRGRKTKTAVADKPKRTIKPKYVTPDGACTWTGRGKMPVKMRELVDAGTPLESMLIEKTPAITVLRAVLFYRLSETARIKADIRNRCSSGLFFEKPLLRFTRI